MYLRRRSTSFPPSARTLTAKSNMRRSGSYQYFMRQDRLSHAGLGGGKKKQKVAGRGERTREAQLLLLLLLRRSSCWKDVLMLQLSRGAGAAPCHGPTPPPTPPSERLLAPVTSTKSGPRQQRPGASASAAAAASASPPPPPPPPVTCLRLPGQGDFVPS